MTNRADDPFGRRDGEPEIYAGLKLDATVTMVLRASGSDFQTREVSRLTLGFDGIEGDLHSGMTRKSGSREPWYARGTEIHNSRQLSIVSAVELESIAQAMGIKSIEPEWIGANLVLDGIANLSMLPAGTLMFFSDGATLKIDGQNKPCRIAGKAVAENAGMKDIGSGALNFPHAAHRRRGLVAWVEKSGEVSAGNSVRLQLPEQWIYGV